MKRKVFTDGNGSKHIFVEGLGEFSPKQDHDSLAEEVERLRDERDEAAKHLTQLHNHLSESERLYKGGALRQEISFLLAKIKGEDNE